MFTLTRPLFDGTPEVIRVEVTGEPYEVSGIEYVTAKFIRVTPTGHTRHTFGFVRTSDLTPA